MGFFSKKHDTLNTFVFNVEDYAELTYKQLVEVNGGCGSGYSSGKKSVSYGKTGVTGPSSSSCSKSYSSTNGACGGSSGSITSSSRSTTSSTYGACGGTSSSSKVTVTNGNSGNSTVTPVIIPLSPNEYDLISVNGECGNTIQVAKSFNETTIKATVPKQYQEKALEQLKKEEKAGLYGSPTDSKRMTARPCEKTALQDVHTGVDIGAITPGVKGDPIFAVSDGKVLRVGLTGSDSTRLEQSLPNGANDGKDTAVYQHAEFIVSEGDTVKRGQIIGYMSDKGTPGQVHLHFEIRAGGVYADQDASKVVDPTDYMPDSYYYEN